ncbi:hypothetical protein A6A29_41175 [Streptomyces sp. TSRI0281]|nr:hypothetical protein A6A29_41175 [Streptomyces sp. TSRI0281]
MTHRSNIVGIHEALVRLTSELKCRIDLEDDLDDVPRLIVVVDDANTTLLHLARYWETFLHDDTMAVVETLTAEIKVTQPRELADYAKAFAGLAEMVVDGDTARALIRAAIDALE